MMIPEETPTELIKAAMQVITYDWRKSSYSSADGNCVEVACSAPGMVAVRDSQDPGGPRLGFGADDWQQFVSAVKEH